MPCMVIDIVVDIREGRIYAFEGDTKSADALMEELGEGNYLYSQEVFPIYL